MGPLAPHLRLRLHGLSICGPGPCMLPGRVGVQGVFCSPEFYRSWATLGSMYMYTGFAVGPEGK